ncbi:MAG: phosphotransferase [Acidimicrobiales bacterium]
MIPAGLAGAFGFTATGPAVALGDGHIHRTWRVPGAAGDVVMQRINTAVFADVAACEANLDRIDRHLAGRGLVAAWCRTAAGTVHWWDGDGVPWRVSRFARGTVGRTVAADARQAFGAARRFGMFAAALADLPGGPLADTIPRFHDLGHRRAQLAVAAAADRCGRRAGCEPELARAEELAAAVAARVVAVGVLPVRAVHNDAKVANVRFDEVTGEATVVVDLDTTMPGTVLADVGELLRTGATRVAEDDAAASVAVDAERVEAVLAGFLAGAGPLLEPAERAALAVGGPLLAVENAVRFLADHLDGDRYYGAARPDHNLDRARVQLSVTEGLLPFC